MANPTLHSDILKDDGAIDAAIAKLEKFGKVGAEALEKVRQAAKKTEEELVGVNAATTANREEIGRSAKEVDKLEKEYQAMKDILSENGKQLAILREGKRKANQITNQEAKLVLAAEGSYNQLSARYSLIKIRLNEMSAAQRSATEEGRALVAESKQLREEMTRLQKETGDTSLSVGNYKDSIKSALEEMNNFPGSAGNVVGGAKGIIGQFTAIVKSPIALVLGSVVSILAALFGGFLKSERGAKLFEKAGALVNGIMSIFVSLANRAVDGITGLFDGGVIDGIKKIGTSILENLVNRIKGAVDIAFIFGRALKSLVTGDLEGLKKAALETGTAVTQIFTGLDGDQQAAIAGVAKETASLTSRFLELAEATRKRKEQNVDLTKSLGDVQKAEAIAQVSANDTTLSFKEQEAALDALEKAQKKRLQIQIQISRNNLSTITDEVNIRKSAGEEILGLLEQQASAIQEVQQLETEYTVATLEASKLRREIRRDEFERSLDFAIDFYDAQKTQLEKQAANDQLTFLQRAEIYNRLVELDRSAFAEQQKLLEGFTGARLNLNELALIDDERIVRERLKQYSLDDVTLGRILETLRERKLATQDILDLEQALTKARNAQNVAPSPLDGIDFGDKAQKEAADKVAKFATDAIQEGRVKMFEELEKNKPTEDIYDLLGINFGRGQDAYKTALDSAKEELLAFASFRSEIADRNVEAAQREVDQAQRALEIQLQNQATGSASRIKAAEDELKAAKDTQAKALSEQQKAQRAEQRLQTIQQASNLVTASAKIWGQLGFPLALPALAIMWGSFISAKVRASQLSKQTNREGTYLDLDFGGSHESGNDIPFGVSRDGKQVLTAERGEGMAVFTSRARRKYGSFIPALVTAMNRGEMETAFTNKSGEGIRAEGAQVITVQTGNGRMEAHLKTIANNTGGERVTVDGRGRIIKNYKNQRTIVNG